MVEKKRNPEADGVATLVLYIQQFDLSVLLILQWHSGFRATRMSYGGMFNTHAFFARLTEALV